MRRGRRKAIGRPVDPGPPIDPPVEPPADVEYDWNGVSATSGLSSNGTRFSQPITVPVNRTLVYAGDLTSGNQLHLPTNYNNYTHKRWEGGTAEVYRIEDGTLNHKGSYSITGGNFYIPFLLSRDVLQGTSYTHTFDGWTKPNVTYWFTVVAQGVDAPDQELSAQINPDFTCTINWSEVLGATGYQIYYSDVPHDQQADFTHLVLDGASLTQHDIVFLKNEITNPSQDMIMNRIYKTNEPGSIEWGNVASVLNNSETFTYSYSDNSVSFKLQPSNYRDILGQYYHSKPEEQWYETLKVGDTYRFTVRVTPTTPVTVRFNFRFQDSDPYEPEVLVTEPTTLTFERQFTEERISTIIGRWNLQVKNDQYSEVIIEDVVLENLSEPWGEVKQSIKNQVTPGMLLRDHSLIKDHPRARNLRQIFSKATLASRGYSLHSHLHNCKILGANPWIQLEWYWTAEEYSDIMAYLGAPVSSGHWAALLRAEMGQVEPWVEVFDKIYYEFGNESWNFLSAFWTSRNATDATTGANVARSTAFGLFCKMGADAMEASPYFNDKIKWVIGGWSRFNYGIEAALSFDKEVFVGIANYSGGWDEGSRLLQDVAKDYRILLTTPVNRLKEGSIEFLANQLAPYPKMKPICYEAGPGYQLNGLNGAKVTKQQKIKQEVIMKSVAAATATLETFLWQAANGFDQNNFFVLGEEGDNWQSMSREGNVFPTWQVCKILQEEFGKGVVTEVITNDPDLWGFKITNNQNEGYAFGNRSITDTKNIPVDLTDYEFFYGYDGVYDDYNRYPEGKILSTSNTYVDDPRSKSIDITKTNAGSQDKQSINPGLFKIFTKV